MMRSLFDPKDFLKQGPASVNITPSAYYPRSGSMWSPTDDKGGTFTGESGVADLDPYTREAKPPSAGTFEPTKPFAPSPFKERLMAIARGPDSTFVEDRRTAIDPRSTMTVEEWVDNHSEWRDRRRQPW